MTVIYVHFKLTMISIFISEVRHVNVDMVTLLYEENMSVLFKVEL